MVKNLTRRQKAVEGTRDVPVAHGSARDAALARKPARASSVWSRTKVVDLLLDLLNHLVVCYQLAVRAHAQNSQLRASALPRRAPTH